MAPVVDTPAPPLIWTPYSSVPMPAPVPLMVAPPLPALTAAVAPERRTPTWLAPEPPPPVPEMVTVPAATAPVMWTP